MSEFKKNGKFITFEGTEGVGKTTAINGLCKRLDEEGLKYIRTREPGGSPFAEQLRELLLAPSTHIDDDTELLLMFAARSDHLKQVILPALDAGKWVVCDRFVDSTVAYQGYGRSNADSIMLHKIDSLIEQFVPRMPEVTFWLDLPIEEGMRRANKRSVADRFEQENLAFFKRVHQGFKEQQQKFSNRIHRIDASGNEEQVIQRIWNTINLTLSP